LRRFLRIVFARALLIFFRRIEVEGAERVPAEGPVIFVANHPNSLVDPLLLLCFAPRPVSFLAKAPLFRMRLIGPFVRAFDSIPVHRQQDAGSDLSKNRETFETARRLLARGGTLALFPEGASHDEPKLLPMKTGAARIALGAAAEGPPPKIVPAGLYYTWKQRFRSEALVVFGEPMAVEPAALDENGSPPGRAVHDLTDRIGAALNRLTLQAETAEALTLVTTAERIFATGSEPAPLVEELALRRRFVEGYRSLAARDPSRLAAVSRQIERFEAGRRAAGLSLDDLEARELAVARVARLAGQNLGALLLSPLALAGAVIHYPAYRLAGFIARRVVPPGEDVLATAKVLVSMLLFPATWLAAAAIAFRFGGWPAAAAALVLFPVCGWCALRASEAFEAILGRAWALVHAVAAKTALKRLLATREAIRRKIRKIAEDVERSPDERGKA
jgi:1-acyl-sn-glycerol-3-phosphate acyltransferase